MKISLIKGKKYSLSKDRRFPLNYQYGIFVEEVPDGFLRFIYCGKEGLLNKEHFKQEDFILES